MDSEFENVPLLERKAIVEVLVLWSDGKINALEVLVWASKFHDLISVDKMYYEDYEGEKQNSVSLEVLTKLDNLDMDLVLKEDIPKMLEFLKTPLGEFDRGYKVWTAYLDQINYTNRQKQLRGNPLYSKFCNE
ncbi:hypothetical protein [Halobacteriovorax sp. HLS]|uniref:hypothetical protein n=1 Tax=Halobacteriovorax sp. HLS TaxID=2234000 RepID=UPI000FD73D18|nr:hypothetical protein [Halobacteriovorax sp. HLS]